MRRTSAALNKLAASGETSGNTKQSIRRHRDMERIRMQVYGDYA